MKVETIKVVNAYKALKEMKVNDMDENEMVSVWNNLKSFRKIVENYDKDVSDRNDSLIDNKAWQAFSYPSNGTLLVYTPFNFLKLFIKLSISFK